MNRQEENNPVAVFQKKWKNRENADIKENNLLLYGNPLTFLFNYQRGYNQGDK